MEVKIQAEKLAKYYDVVCKYYTTLYYNTIKKGNENV
tara:strand:+ start:683 stop:793 length:111 start_codon:yes stop_codon:yes gene_type:complete